MSGRPAALAAVVTCWLILAPREVTVRRCDEHDGLEAAEARQSLALRLDKDLPSAGCKLSMLALG